MDKDDSNYVEGVVKVSNRKEKRYIQIYRIIKWRLIRLIRKQEFYNSKIKNIKTNILIKNSQWWYYKFNGSIFKLCCAITFLDLEKRRWAIIWVIREYINEKISFKFIVNEILGQIH